MDFKTLKIKTSYDKNKPGVDILNDFYIPVLEQSVKYDRIGSYFRSSVFIANAKGMAQFILNGGVIRLIGDVTLSEKDVEAIQRGEDNHIAEKEIENYFNKKIEKLKDKILNNRFEFLSYLIASNKLQIRIAIVKGSNEHSKLGIFKDKSKNTISFLGSINESYTGWGPQGNKIPVFCSWLEESRVTDDMDSFEIMWNNKGQNTKVYDFPDAVRKELLDVIPFDHEDEPATKSYLKRLAEIDDDAEVYALNIHKPDNYPKYPSWLINGGLFSYQKSMLELWKEHSQKGMFAMATGTGKTITALAASTNFFYEKEKMLLLICCPNDLLVKQWSKECKDFSYSTIVATKDYKKWAPKVKTLNKLIHNSLTDLGVIITNKQTLFAKNGRLLNYLEKFNEVPKLFIADEVHNLGSKSIREKLPEHFPYRIGLTATPKRYFDDIGTKALYEYFGDEMPVDPPVDLKFAIENNYLTKYNYFPHLVFLSDDETQDYHDLTIRIKKMRSFLDEDDEGLKRAYQQRVDILNNAENKIDVLNNILQKIGKISKTLFFCSPNNVEDVTSMLIDDYNFIAKKIGYDESKYYDQIINEFSSGLLDALCAIYVIDEGLDVPSTENAFFLASSGNEKQFIQRRGRVLRKADCKNIANIHDFIVVPNGNIEKNTNIVKIALEREIRRFSEMAELADNHIYAKSVVLKIALDNNVVV
jgi:superfamily II DNA or RNA helicase